MDNQSRDFRPEDVDSACISAYMRSKGIKLRCTFCGNLNISLNEVTTSAGFCVDTALGTYSNLYLMNSQYAQDAYLNPLALSCEDCGHIMFFDIEIIMEWLRKNPTVIMGETVND